MAMAQMEARSQTPRMGSVLVRRHARKALARMEEQLLIPEIRDMVKEYFKSSVGPVTAGTTGHFIRRHFEGEVSQTVISEVEKEFERRRKAVEHRQSRGRELQKQVVVKNCSIDIEEEEGARATPASSSRSKSEPRKPSYVDGRIDFLMALVQWLMEQRLPVDLTSITRFAPWLQSRYTLDKKGRRPQLFVFTAADVEAILKEHFPGNYRKGHLADPKKWEFMYEKSEFVRLSVDEDEVLLGAIRELHGAGHKKESVLGTAELLHKQSPQCRERRLGDLAQQMKELLSESQRRLRYDGAGKVECV